MLNFGIPSGSLSNASSLSNMRVMLNVSVSPRFKFKFVSVIKSFYPELNVYSPSVYSNEVSIVPSMFPNGLIFPQLLLYSSLYTSSYTGSSVAKFLG